jgi:hypothetical protein
MQEQNKDQPGKTAGQQDRQRQGETAPVDPAAPTSKNTPAGGGDPQTNADQSPANGGIDPKRGF